MPSMRLTTPARVALGLGLAVLVLFLVFFIALASAGPKHDDDPCSKPVSQRTGGWVCPG